MPRTRRSTLAIGASLLSTAALAGCLGDDGDDDDTAPADDTDDHGDPTDVADDPFDEIGIDEFELLDRAHDPHDMVAYMHDDHWHGDLPHVPLGETLSIGATAETDAGEALELGDEYELKVATAAGASDDILSYDYHGDHVHLIGDELGVTEVVFLLWHDNHADYQTDAISVQVVEEEADEHDHHFDAHHVDTVRIFDRGPDPHEEVADWHDEDWHGEIPSIPVDEALSLGAEFIDDDGNEADLDHDFELRARIGDGEPEIFTVDYHGDHIHLIGDEAGETEIVFQLWHDDHADFETTPIDVSVTNDDSDNTA